MRAERSKERRSAKLRSAAPVTNRSGQCLRTLPKQMLPRPIHTAMVNPAPNQIESASNAPPLLYPSPHEVPIVAAPSKADPPHHDVTGQAGAGGISPVTSPGSDPKVLGEIMSDADSAYLVCLRQVAAGTKWGLFGTRNIQRGSRREARLRPEANAVHRFHRTSAL